jgi:hypothetical protein
MAKINLNGPSYEDGRDPGAEEAPGPRQPGPEPEQPAAAPAEAPPAPAPAPRPAPGKAPGGS